MSDKRIDVSLRLDDNFSSGLLRVADAAKAMHLDWCLREATWEPHDWQAWS